MATMWMAYGYQSVSHYEILHGTDVCIFISNYTHKDTLIQVQWQIQDFGGINDECMHISLLHSTQKLGRFVGMPLNKYFRS